VTNPLRPEDILLRLATATAAVTGEDFLLCLVQELAAYLDASEVFLTERHPVNLMQIQTLANWKNGEIQLNLAFSLNEAPACYEVLAQCNALQFVLNPQRQIIDPQILTAETIATAHYTGGPLIGNNQFAIGHLAVIGKAPLPADFIPVIQVYRYSCGLLTGDCGFADAARPRPSAPKRSPIPEEQHLCRELNCPSSLFFLFEFQKCRFSIR
jgi:hypothetical protein